jgi:hypothetical protein
MENEVYLGDGLYTKFDGWNFWLRAPREDGDHYVALEPATLASFLEFVREARPDLHAIGGWVIPSHSALSPQSTTGESK